MNSRWVWNLHQKRHKFLRGEAARDILKFRVLEMAFPGVVKRYFPPRKPRCFIRIVWEQCRHPFPPHRTVQKFHRSEPVEIHICAFNVSQNALQFHFIVLIFCQQLQLKEMKVRRLRMANQPAVLAGYRPLLTALMM